jgi:hypothetical protein
MRKIPKILTTGPRDTVLMFQDRLATSDHAIICEGPVDALKCHLVGGNVATMGKVVSSRQIEIIKGSAASRKSTWPWTWTPATETMKLLKAFNDYVDTGDRAMFEVYSSSQLPGYEDLGAMPVEAMPRQLCSAAAPAGSLFLDLGA